MKLKFVGINTRAIKIEADMFIIDFQHLKYYCIVFCS